MSVNDFPIRYKSFADFLNEEANWALVDNDVYSVRNMSEKELKQSIIQDIVGVTMFEKEFGYDCYFGLSNLVVRLDGEYCDKIHKLLATDPEITGMVEFVGGKGYRIKNDRETLQKAMDYSGVWYDGFDMPEDVIIRDMEGLEMDEDDVVEFLERALDSISSHGATHGNKDVVAPVGPPSVIKENSVAALHRMNPMTMASDTRFRFMVPGVPTIQ